MYRWGQCCGSCTDPFARGLDLFTPGARAPEGVGSRLEIVERYLFSRSSASWSS